MMEKKVRVYEMSQGESKNIQVVEKLTFHVHRIEEQMQRVFFTLNPNLVEYEQSRNRQSVMGEAIDDTRQGGMTPNDPPFPITIEGTEYRISVDSIGTEQAKSGFREAYCDFVISWTEPKDL